MAPKHRHLRSGEIAVFLTLFLTLLQSYPIIWNTRLKDYSYKPLRDGQIGLVLEELAKAGIFMDAEEFRGKTCFFGKLQYLFQYFFITICASNPLVFSYSLTQEHQGYLLSGAEESEVQH